MPLFAKDSEFPVGNSLFGFWHLLGILPQNSGGDNVADAVVRRNQCFDGIVSRLLDRYAYAAWKLVETEAHPDEGEFLEVEKIPLEEAVDMVMRGEIPDGKTQTLVMRVAEMKIRGIIRRKK